MKSESALSDSGKTRRRGIRSEESFASDFNIVFAVTWRSGKDTCARFHILSSSSTSASPSRHHHHYRHRPPEACNPTVVITITIVIVLLVSIITIAACVCVCVVMPFILVAVQPQFRDTHCLARACSSALRHAGILADLAWRGTRPSKQCPAPCRKQCSKQCSTTCRDVQFHRGRESVVDCARC